MAGAIGRTVRFGFTPVMAVACALMLDVKMVVCDALNAALAANSDSFM